MGLYIHIYIYICVCVCVYTHTLSVHTHTHTHTHTHKKDDEFFWVQVIYIFVYIYLCISRGSGLFCRVQCLIFRVFGLGQDQCFFCFLFFPHQTCTQTHAHTRLNLNSYKLGSKQEKKEKPPFQGSCACLYRYVHFI